MGTSVLHIKTEVECRVYLFDEEKGIAKPGTYFNLEVRKGEQDLLFVSTEDETVRCQTLYEVEENDSDYRLTLERSEFKQYSKELLEDIKLAEQGDAEAQFRLGKRHYEGDGVEWDYNEAAKWYHMAAEHGNTNAQYNLGVLYEQDVLEEWGPAWESDLEEAMKWFCKAAENGNANAQYRLGEYYEDSDWGKADKWYRMAAEQGDAKAQIRLGSSSEMSCDWMEAMKWYRKAAKQGDAYGQYHLGQIYEIVGDWKEALRWYCRTKEQKDEDSDSIIYDVDNKINYFQLLKQEPPYFLFYHTVVQLFRTSIEEYMWADGEVEPVKSRLIRLSWLLTDEGGDELSQGNEIVKIDGFEKTMQEGKPLRTVLEIFMKDANRAKCIVGHNNSDKKVVMEELRRLHFCGGQNILKSLCLMQANANLCKIKTYNDYKMSELQRLYYNLFGCDFKDAHDAMADITATKKCFFEMRKRGLI